MAADILDALLRSSVASSLAIIAILLLRGPTRAAFGARVAYALWLIVPFATIASLIPARRMAAMESGAAAADPVAVPSIGAAMSEVAVASNPDASIFIDISALIVGVWAAGFAASFFLLILGHKRFMARLGLRRGADCDFVIAENTSTGPAVIGILRPRIMLPADFAARYTPAEQALVIAHERAHLATCDAQVNTLAALAQCLNWYNPLFYIARALLRVDQELACDENVMRRNGGQRRAYGEAMLKTQLAAARAIPLGCYWPPLGAAALKSRIAMLKRPAPAPLRQSVGIGLCVGAALFAGVAAWAAQPPRPALADIADTEENDASPRGRALGRALVEAILDSDRETALALIEAGADIDYFLAGDGTPLVVAAQRRDDKIARALLNAGADVNKPAPGDGNPLIVAAMRGDMTLARLFVESGADVNAIVPADETPLINAAWGGRLTVAEFLIDNGADVNLAVDAPTISGVERRSPLSMARRGGHDDMVRMLLNRGARD